jgi:outer membrane immunogenic protein
VDTTKAGWTVGGGVEYAFAPNWSVKAEYLYADLGDVSFTTVDRSGFFPTFNESISVSSKLNIATVGLNYKF